MQILVSAVRRILTVLALFSLVLLGWYSLQLARSDSLYRQNTPETVARAIHLARGNAEHHELLAEHLESLGRDPDFELAEATRLSPFESRYWIRRAFRAEVERKYSDAQKFLLAARQVDNGFDPRWALMNYYFRREQMPEFWAATTDTLRMSYGNINPVFRLCLAANPDPGQIRKVLPPGRPYLLALLRYLEAERMDSTAQLANELSQDMKPAEADLFLDYCRRQAGRDNGAAVPIWNALCVRKVLPFQPLAPDRGAIVTNGTLSPSAAAYAFDWQYPDSKGVSAGPRSEADSFALVLDGTQADDIVLAAEELPLSRGKAYEIAYEYRLVGDSPDSGLTWTVRSGTGELLVRSPILNSRDWATGQLRFPSGDRQGARLQLEHARTPATPRWSGTVQIRQVHSALAGGPRS